MDKAQDFLTDNIIHYIYLQPEEVVAIRKISNKFNQFTNDEIYEKLTQLKSKKLIKLTPKAPNVQIVGHVVESTAGQTSFAPVDSDPVPTFKPTHVELLFAGKQQAEYGKAIRMRTLHSLITKPALNSVISFITGAIFSWLATQLFN